MQTAGVILLLAAGVIVFFGGAQPKASQTPVPIVPHQAGLLLR